MSQDQERKSASGEKLESEEKDRFGGQYPPDTGEAGFQGKTIALVEEGQVHPQYQAKAQVLNDAIQEVGMGKYQWHLFVVAGFGWFSDNVRSLFFFQR
jgi:hypothetical protein